MTHLPRATNSEFLDLPAAHAHDLPENLRDIRRLNRWFGGTSLALRYLRSFGAGLEELSVLDVATGSADIPVAAWHDATRRGVRLHLTALDWSDEVLRQAREVVGPHPIRLVRADARSLPFADGEFDVALCCLALHHFEPADAVRVLREMRRVSGRAAVVIDLRRGYLGYLAAWLATRSVARHRLTRHDGPLSVLRAYRTDEVRTLALAAGLPHATVRRHQFFRQALVARTGPGGA